MSSKSLTYLRYTITTVVLFQNNTATNTRENKKVTANITGYVLSVHCLVFVVSEIHCMSSNKISSHKRITAIKLCVIMNCHYI